jgi:hypothetical protein
MCCVAERHQVEGVCPDRFFLHTYTNIVCKAEGSGGGLWNHRHGRCPLGAGSAATVGDLPGLAAPSLLSFYFWQHQVS